MWLCRWIPPFQEKMSHRASQSRIHILAVTKTSYAHVVFSCRCFVTMCTTYNLACQNHAANSKYVLFSNKVGTVLDLLLYRLTVSYIFFSSLSVVKTYSVGSALELVWKCTWRHTRASQMLAFLVFVYLVAPDVHLFQIRVSRRKANRIYVCCATWI